MTQSGRQRGIFPLPLPTGEVKQDHCPCSSRSVGRRLGEKAHVNQWVLDLVVTLNSLYAGAEYAGSFAADQTPATLSQRLCLDRLRTAVLDAGKPPEGLTGQGALSELRTLPGYSGEPASLAPLQLELLSLPPKGSEPASLEKILEGKAERISERLMSKVVSESEVVARKGQVGVRCPYSDPLLKRCPRVYASFCRKLAELGLVEYRRECTERVGAFTVWKKSGRQRLVIDCRAANLHFEQPERVHLATGSAFARLAVDSGEPVKVGGVDIADAFYNIQLLPELRGYFGLPSVRASRVDVTHAIEGKCKPNDLIVPVLKVVPMGWTHALWVCQSCHEVIVDEIPRFAFNPRLVDRQPAPGMDPLVHTEYVDNFVALSQRPGLAFELANEVGQRLRERGLPTHEVEAGRGIETLGWKFSETEPVVKVTAKRLWRLRLATQELLREGRSDGRLIERLVGHYTFVGLLCRGLLSSSLLCLIRKDMSIP